MLRAIPDFMNRDSVSRIDARLHDIAATDHVAIPLAIESGSRAWGFPSPDSDYDCRFIFVRSPVDYLSLFPKRDVIETPLDGDLDVNGWDIAKALKLLLKGNAVVIEWVTSPIVYFADEWFRSEFLSLARRVVVRERVARHYLHLGERQRHAYFADDKQVKLKKLFYALRPAAALRWLRQHPHEAVAPMHFPTLMLECDPPAEVRTLVEELTAKKAVTNELGSGFLPPAIAAFIDSEFEAGRATFEGDTGALPATASANADAFYRAVLARLGNFSSDLTKP
jgi:hypothetical protein